MPLETIAALTTGEWLVAVGSGVLLLLSIAPVIWACWHFVQMSDDAVARAIMDVERFVEERDRVRRLL